MESENKIRSAVSRLAGLLPLVLQKPAPEPNPVTSAIEVDQAIGSLATSVVVSEAEVLIEQIRSGDPLASERIVNLIIRSRVTFPGDSPQGIFLNLFLSLRTFMEGRHRPYVNALFDAACRSIEEMEDQKRIDKSRRRADIQDRYGLRP